MKLPYVSQSVQDVLLWKDAKISSMAFASATLVWFFVGSGFSPFTPMQLLALGVMLVIPAMWAWHTAAPFLGRQGPPVPIVLQEGLNEADSKELADKIRLALNPVLGFIGRLVSGQDAKLSWMVTGIAYAAWRVFGSVSLFTLAYIVVVLAFTLPKAYEYKQKEVDELIGFTSAKVKELYAKVDEVVFKKISKPKKME